jgi:hypothetical protein
MGAGERLEGFVRAVSGEDRVPHVTKGRRFYVCDNYT